MQYSSSTHPSNIRHQVLRTVARRTTPCSPFNLLRGLCSLLSIRDTVLFSQYPSERVTLGSKPYTHAVRGHIVSFRAHAIEHSLH